MGSVFGALPNTQTQWFVSNYLFLTFLKARRSNIMTLAYLVFGEAASLQITNFLL